MSSLSFNLIFIEVSPFLNKTLEISLSSFVDLRLNVTSFIGLFKRSFKEAILFTFILLNLLRSSDIDLVKVKINELPSSLKHAIRIFIITRAIQVKEKFRKNNNSPDGGVHHTMIINVSRFVLVQGRVYEK